MKAINNATVGFDTDKNKAERRWAYVLYEFPEGTKLSATVINEDGREGKYLDIQIFAIMADNKSSTYCGWVVADLSKEHQKEGSVRAPVEVICGDYCKGKARKTRYLKVYLDIGVFA